MPFPAAEPFIVLALLVAVFAAMVTERMRSDVVALLGMAVLLLLGISSTQDVLAVFSNEAPVTVAAMFVLSAALDRTGVIERAGELATGMSGDSAWRALIGICLGAMLISGFINNTPVVVILTPIVFALAHRLQTPASKFLIPLSYATILGGTCTLIGTSTNIIVSGAAQQAGLERFTLFEITPAGLIYGVVGFLYMMLVGVHLLPSREVFSTIMRGARQRQFLTEVLVPHGSPLVGKTVEGAGIAKKLGARVTDVIRHRISLADQMDGLVLQPGDRLVLRTNAGDVLNLRAQSDLIFESEGQHVLEPIAAQRTAIMEGIVGPQSRFVGYRVADLNLRRQFGIYILAIHRQNENLRANFDQVRLAFGDTILLEGPPEGLKRMFEQGALVSLSEPTERPLRRGKAWLALAALVGVILLAALEVMPISALALIAAAVVIAGGCIDPDDAYTAIHWPIITLIFGMLAIGKAMESSGAALMIVDWIMRFVSDMGPWVVLSMVYFLTMLLTEFISNNATAILLTPIAVGVAEQMGVDPRPFVVAVMFAASASFATPIGYQTNTFVYHAGGYRFIDFVKVGAPLNLILWVVASFLIPFFWPL